MEKISATQKLLTAFKQGRKFTSHSANASRLSVCLPKRISEFESKGFVFKREWSVTPKVVRHYVYYMDMVKTPKELLK